MTLSTYFLGRWNAGAGYRIFNWFCAACVSLPQLAIMTWPTAHLLARWVVEEIGNQKEKLLVTGLLKRWLCTCRTKYLHVTCRLRPNKEHIVGTIVMSAL